MSGSFRIVPGDPSSPMIVHVPHSSRSIPADVRAGIVLTDVDLERELDAMTDAFTDAIAERAAEMVEPRPWLFINLLSRLVVDPERFPDDREKMNAVGMGAVYVKTSEGSDLRDLPVDGISGLVDRYFEPYGAALSALVDDRVDALGGATIIDLHSYPLDALPYELHKDGPRPEVCLGTDPFHTPPELRETAQAALVAATPHGDVGLDSPFEGCYVPLKHYGVSPDVHAIMIELRRDLYMDETFSLIDDGAAPLAQGVAEVIARDI